MTHPKYSNERKESEFKEMPIAIKVHLKQYEFASSERIHSLTKNKSASAIKSRGLR